MSRGSLAPFALIAAGCSLLYPLDFTAGPADGGTSGGAAGGLAAGGSSGGAGGGVSGGASGGVSGGSGGSSGGASGGVSGGTSGGVSGGTSGGVSGGTSGGSSGGTSGGSAGGSIPDAGPCGPIAGTTVLVCYEFETPTLPGTLERTSPSAPSTLLTAEVIFDGGRPGGVLRMTMPAFPSQNSVAHGAWFRTPVGNRRRFRLAYDVRPVAHQVPDQIHSASFEGGPAWVSLAGDPGGHFLYVPTGLGLASARGTTVGQWQHYDWFMDFSSSTTVVTVDGVTLLDGGVSPGASATFDFRFGWNQYHFDSPAVLLFDNVVLREVP